MKQAIYKILLIIVLSILVLGIAITNPVGKIIYIRLALIFFIIGESITVFKSLFVERKVNSIVSNIASVFISTFVFLLVLEAIFMFIPKSHGAGYALSAQLWLNKYQKPMNSYGNRDVEPKKSDKVVLFVGDSFTEGQGIEDVDDRFSNIVGNTLEAKDSSISAINIGKRGYDTAKEFAVMERFIEKSGIQPNTIVLQYFGNDIDEVGFANGIGFKTSGPYSNVPGPLRPLVRGSYFLNFFYWVFPQGDAEPYRKFLYEAYNTDSIFSKHENDLKLFIDYANENSVRLIVVVFPFLWDTKSSDELYVNKIVDLFRGNDIDVISVSPLVQDIPVAERVINANDSHASEAVNKKVAEAILKYF